MKILLVFILELIVFSSVVISNSSKHRIIKSRKLAISPETLLIFVIEMDIALFEIPPSILTEKMSSKLHIALPFTVHLSELESQYTHFLKEELQMINEIVHPWWMKYIPEKKRRQRQGRSVKMMNHKSYTKIDRNIIFEKLEIFLESMGLPGRPCILRTICEVHEFPNWNIYGFFGELFPTLFRISKVSQNENTLAEHFQAQFNGHTGNCSMYETECGKSLFTNHINS